MTKATKVLEANLKGLNYPEIERALAKTAPQILIELLDSKSTKIGGSAAGLLKGSQAYHLLISSILENRITTKLGKIRATNTLFSVGRRYPEALKAHLVFLNDQNREVADNALLGLVFWGDKRVIPLIKERGKRAKSATDAKEFERACDALEKADPASFSPNFADDAGTWK